MSVEPEVSVAVPEVPGVLSASDVLATAHAIAEVQQPDGMIPWFPGGHCDPWNHVEAAMALSVCGLHAEVELAYEWLAGRQLADGSWFNYYLAEGVKDPRLDTNVCAYVAAGLWHHHLVSGEDHLLRRLWPTMERAVDFVLRWQRPDGSVRWSLDPAGRPEGYALLTGSSSVYHSLRCGVAVAERLGKDRPDWELAAGRLGHAVAHHPSAFAPKHEFAMDWYYPMLSGALEGGPGRARMDAYWDAFVMPGLGVRCVSTNDWVTAAETAECVMALDALGMDDAALDLFEAAGAAAPRRLVLDRDGLPRAGLVPGGGAHHLHRRRRGAGRRRPLPDLAGQRPLPGRDPPRRVGPGRAPLHRGRVGRLHRRAGLTRSGRDRRRQRPPSPPGG
jgi:hypothetical protein